MSHAAPSSDKAVTNLVVQDSLVVNNTLVARIGAITSLRNPSIAGVTLAVSDLNATLNASAGYVTLTGTNAAQYNSNHVTIFNSAVNANSIILVSVRLYVGDGIPLAKVNNVGNGQFDLYILNVGDNALTGEAIRTDFMVVNPW